jgi:2-polyprenyl-6-methoxyphenol hydroxylase-like FAD-dependent oxidoreductase
MRAPESRRAVVVGAGIGGLATALALQQDGWEVRVLERDSALAGGGAGLVLSPNAQRCLSALGVVDEIRSRAAELVHSSVLRPDGRVLARVDLGTAAGPSLGIVRADLVELLAGALAPGTLEPGRVVLDAATLEGDVVVGADGLRSVVRAGMGSTVQPVFRGYTVWRALIPDISDRIEPAALAESWGRGERFGVVPVADGWTYVYACANAREGGKREDELGELRRRFAGWHDPIPDLLAAIEPGTVLRHDIHDLSPGATALHRDRFVLVGDAGHAMEPNLGQGAGLALEDAVVLAHALAAEPTIEFGLARYARERSPRVRALGRQSRRVGLLAQHGHPGVAALRDLSLRLTPSGVARLAAGRATSWRPPVSPRPNPQEIR